MCIFKLKENKLFKLYFKRSRWPNSELLQVTFYTDYNKEQDIVFMLLENNFGIKNETTNNLRVTSFKNILPKT